jgi:tetratricopeptide (TPR) repeat protein
MAQDRVVTPTPSVTEDHPNVGNRPQRLAAGEHTVTTDIAVDIPPDVQSMASIDRLLAMSEEGWDIDNEVRTLQNVALRASQVPPAPPSNRPASLRMPTPYELAPLTFTTPAPIQVRPRPGVPPPLPPSAAKGARPSKGPPPLPGRGATESGAVPRLPTPKPDPLGATALIDLLAARIATLEGGDDPVGLAHAQIETAIAHELLGDDARCTTHAEAALKIDPDIGAAHAFLRRRRHGRGALTSMLGHLDKEITAATEEAGRVELLVERARLLDATGEKSEAVRAAWEQALTHASNHPAALKGLEAELVARANTLGTAEAYDALATHLGRMADAYGSEPRLAAWLHVERAQILERKLGRLDAARGALERALELDPGVGPVRDAFVRHISARQDAAAMVAALDQEAYIEHQPARSARLELDAACIANERLGDPGRAIALLERAASRAPTSAVVDWRILDDLVRLRELRGEWGQAARARRDRLRFVSDPLIVAQELRTLATMAERLGDLDAATADIQAAIGLDGTDPTLVEALDRLLASAGKDEQRSALWLTEAARAEEGPKRARALVRAAHIAEQALGRPADAVRHLRSAWVSAPGDPEVLDALARLLTPSLSETVDGDARALIDLYVQASEHAHDQGRRVAYLEKMALLWEDVVGDARRAAKAYEEILTLEPNRRGAILGLARSAARIGDDRALARALLDEARMTDDGVDALALRTRAATALARVDSARALALVGDVLTQEPAHVAARALETRIHEESRRWESASASIRQRIEHAPKSEQLGLWLALANLQDTRLHAPKEALASLRAAHALDPRHPVPAEAIARMLESTGDYETLRTALEQLAHDAHTPQGRARHLLRAGEIEELRLGDDARAAVLYGKAHAETPDDELIAGRLIRVLDRRATNAAVQSGPSALPAKDPRSASSLPPVIGSAPTLLRAIPSPPPSRPPGPHPSAELASALGKRIDRAGSTEGSLVLSFELAALLVGTGQDINRATTILETVVSQQSTHIPALRTLEAIHRKTSAWTPLARVMSDQADAFGDLRARLGALWQVAALEEWRLPVTNPANTYARILELDPAEPSALEAIVRRELANARRGDLRARKAVILAMRQLCALAAEDTTRLALQLQVATLIEQSASESPDGSGHTAAREALDRYRAALRIDPLSVTATTGLARLSGRLNDVAGAVAAATALASLSVDTKVRARYLLDAAELLLSNQEHDELGTPFARAERAADILEKALEADPDSIPAAAHLATTRLERRQGERLVDTFRGAIRRAKSPEAIVHLGTEIAHVARDTLRDLTIAIDAMRRVREASPLHVPSLLTLAELCIAQRTWPEAVDALEAVVAATTEPAPRLTALFALASIYEKVLARADEAERVLRTALETEPTNARALRALLRRLTADPQASVSGAPGPGSGSPGGRSETPGGAGTDAPARRADPKEVAELVSRLADVERDPDQKCSILLELAEIRMRLDDAAGAERALVDAVAHAPSNAKAFARLATLSRRPNGQDAVHYARSLNALINRGQQLGKVDARWLATLGQLEIDSLNRARDGISRLQRAVQMDPTLYETRFELASAFARAGANEDASRAILTMMTPDARPLLSISDPASAIALLERVLQAERRGEEALVVSELRAIAGDLDEGRYAWLRARRLGPLEPHHGQLDRATLVTHVLPQEGRHVLLEVAAAVAGIDAKMLRTDLTELGISPRDRLSARSGHPTRAVLDRVMRTLGVSDVELVIAASVTRTRVIAHDQPWIVVPRSLTELPEPTQLASIARAVARIAFGVPWLEELPPPHIEALLVAAARQVVPHYAFDDIDVFQSKAVAQYEPTVARILTRRQKKLLEELAPHISSPQGRPLPVDVFVSTLTRAELRAAYLVCGDLLAAVDEMRAVDVALSQSTERPGPGALQAVLEHTYTADLCRFALTPEATGLRRRVGSIWTA